VTESYPLQHFTASPSVADFVLKAVKKVVEDHIGHEEVIDKEPNPAMRRLMEEADLSFNLMSESLVREVRKILDAEPRAESTEKSQAEQGRSEAGRDSPEGVPDGEGIGH
jgi:hypothetical protein